MAISVPLRHELKFFISPLESQVLSRALDRVLWRDRNGDENNEYHIRSLYFDTRFNDALLDKINGVKEASGNISQVAEIAAACGTELNIYSGNDDQIVPLLALGGKGVISVVSNVKPELVHNCCKAWFEGDPKTACKLQLEILPLADALFCEVNPIPVKYAMNVLGWEAGSCRLPLVEPSDAHKEKIEQALEAEGLIQE